MFERLSAVWLRRYAEIRCKPVVISKGTEAKVKIQNLRIKLNEHNSFALKQFSKFSLIGILNTVVGYGSFIILLNFSNYILALIISHMIGVTHSYLWNKFWTFKSNKNPVNEFVKFNSIYLVVFVINAITLIFLVSGLNFDPRIGQLIALPIITLISFTGHKYWSFK